MTQSPKDADLAVIYLARHCKTHWNIQGRIQGSHDLPLCEAGRAQAGAIAPTLVGYKFDTIVSSPYQRALQTAAIYAQYLQIDVHRHDGLKELNHGSWEGEPIDALLSDKDSGYQQWLQDACSLAVPGGEELEAAQQRITEAIRDTALQFPGRRVLVITHKHIRALLRCRLGDLSLSRFGQAIDERVQPVEITKEEMRRLCQYRSDPGDR